MKDLKRDLEFLFEMGTLRFKPRSWIQFYNSDCANITEHTFRVIWIAIIIAKNEGNSNIDQIIKLALAHDISESRGVDVNYISREFTERKEELSIKATFSGTSIEEDFIKIWEEAEKKSTIEAKIVKDADNLDVDIELLENEYSTGSKFRDSNKETRKVVREEKLYTNTAKEIWDLIQNSNPFEWIVTNSEKNMRKVKSAK